ncbi:hypothetical protein QYE76_012737 [Lolium multiflorum]|uniref:CCHC-type domain-containing protein n=1 Tax=Lolium multiflorum TaxID=4521 RepID=A0AAD8TXN5_LOLMU|nr:hypothetical protein QYE76_012737 [Lolium multiflorum]
MMPKRKTIGYTKPYPNEYELIPLPPKYRLPDFTKFSGSDGSSSIEHVSRYLAQLGMISASDELRVRRREVATGEQEVAVAEWTRAAGPVTCKWVKPPGPPRGFDFDVTKTEQIFDLLLAEKHIKIPEGHKVPTVQELNGKPYCKWHNTFTHTTNDCRVWRRQIQMAIGNGRLIFNRYAMKVDTHPFPAVNMVEFAHLGGCQPDFSANISMNMNKEFPELFGMLKAAEIEIKKEHQVLMVNKTTVSRQGKSKGKFKKGGKKAATPPVKPKSGPKPDAECYYCKEKGHWKRNCSKYLADLKSGLVKKKKEEGLPQRKEWRPKERKADDETSAGTNMVLVRPAKCRAPRLRDAPEVDDGKRTNVIKSEIGLVLSTGLGE